MPDVSTKELAQAYIGLDMEKLNAEKNTFKKGLMLEWIKDAEEREAKMPQYEQGNASKAIKASLEQ